jgi:hypothetical protein
LFIKWLQIFGKVDDARDHRDHAAIVREKEKFVEKAER